MSENPDPGPIATPRSRSALRQRNTIGHAPPTRCDCSTALEPRGAIRKVHGLLAPRGRLALVWNRIVPTAPSQTALDDAANAHSDRPRRAPTPGRASAAREVFDLLRREGFAYEVREEVVPLRYTAAEWVDMASTYSVHLTLPPESRVAVRDRLAAFIGDTGVEAENRAFAVIARL